METIPNGSMRGCFFFISESVYRYIQSSGLQSWYTDVSITRMIKCFQALDLAPDPCVQSQFNNLNRSLSEETF